MDPKRSLKIGDTISVRVFTDPRSGKLCTTNSTDFPVETFIINDVIVRPESKSRLVSWVIETDKGTLQVLLFHIIARHPHILT